MVDPGGGAERAASTAEGDRAVVTVFRSRLREGVRQRYAILAAELEATARAMPGFVSFKTFAADDGERVSVIVFDCFEHHRAWRDHPDHRRAQELGRREFYAAYDITVCEVASTRRFGGRPAGASTGNEPDAGAGRS